MILTGTEIINARERGEITITDFNPSRINPNSYNVRLGSVLRIYTDAALDARRENPTATLEIPAEGIMLQPNRLYLGHTVEQVGSRCHVPVLDGRSSTAHLGLFVEITAPIGDIGFLGQRTLQLHVVQPLRVRAGMAIGQIHFHTTLGPVVLYSGKYQGAAGPQPSQAWRDLIPVPTSILPPLMTHEEPR